MQWRIIVENFEPNIQNIAQVEKILVDTPRRMPFTPVDKYKPNIVRAMCHTNELFVLVWGETTSIVSR